MWSNSFGICILFACPILKPENIIIVILVKKMFDIFQYITKGQQMPSFNEETLFSESRDKKRKFLFKKILLFIQVVHEIK